MECPSTCSSEEEKAVHVEEEDGEISKDGPFPSQEEVCVAWVGPGGRTPVMLFSADIVQQLMGPLATPLSSPYRMTFKFGKNSECKIMRATLFVHGFSEVPSTSGHFNVLWSNLNVVKPHFLKLLLPYQKVNHFPRSYELTRKDRLCRNVQRMQQSKGLKHFNIIPKSFVLPADANHFHATFRKQRGTWIVKPIASSRGRGISLINHPSQLPPGELVVVSKYVENPLCIDDFKFDVRLYVAVTSYSPLRVYLFEEGLARFATVQYAGAGEELHNFCMHLTNYSLNKKSVNYVRCDDPEVEDYGNKWSMSAMLRYLQEAGMDTAGLMMRVEDVIIKTLLCGVQHISSACTQFQPHRGNCFELYGFDVLIDEHLQPWVLEVNLSPSLTCDAPLDIRIKSNLVADLLSLTGIVVQDPYTGEIQGQEKATRLQSRTRRPSCGGLSAEQAAIVRESREEYARRGGFVRIFPTEDSWELYGSFIESDNSLDYILHSQLYPESVKNARPVAPASLSTVIAKRLETASVNTSSKASGGSPRGLTALERVAVYTRKLKNKSHGPSKPKMKASTSLHRAEKNSAIDSCGSGMCTTVSTTLRKEMVHHIIDNAALLSKLEARHAFASYLERVQNRLLKNTSIYTPQVGTEKDQSSVDLVTHFLKKAALNLKTPFTVIVPNHQLPLRDRRRILAKQLSEFVSLYRKETTQLEGEDIEDAHGFSPEVLKTFLHQASEEDLEKLLATYAKQNKSSVFLGGTHDPTTSSPQCYTTAQGSSRGLQECNKTGRDRAVNQATSSGAGLQENPKTTSSHPQLRKNPISSQVDQYSAHTPVTRTPKSAWTGDVPLSSSLHPKHCTEHTESHQKSLESLTRFLLGVNCNSTNTLRSQGARTGADPGERRSSAAGRVRLNPHQRSLSVQSVASTTSSTASNVSQRLCHLRRLSSANLQWVQSSGRPAPAIISAVKSYVSPYAQSVQTKISKNQAKTKGKVPPPPLHPALSEESITQALQRLTQRQKMRRHAAPSEPRRPILAQTCLQKDKSIHTSEASPGEQRNELTESQKFLKRGNLCTLQGPGVQPHSPRPHSASRHTEPTHSPRPHSASRHTEPTHSPRPHSASRHTEPTDLQLRILTHNQAIAKHVLMQHPVSNSPSHMTVQNFIP